MGRVVHQSGFPRPVLIVAISLAALLAVAVAALGVVGGQGPLGGGGSGPGQQANRHGPLALPPVPAPKAGTPQCSQVLSALPDELLIGGDHVPRRPFAQPAPPGAVAWGDTEHDPVVVRCGLEAPAELTPTSQLADISRVDWLDLSEAGTTSWLAVDRPVYVALTAPGDAGTGPVQDLSAVLADTLPKEPAFPKR